MDQCFGTNYSNILQNISAKFKQNEALAGVSGEEFFPMFP